MCASVKNEWEIEMRGREKINLENEMSDVKNKWEDESYAEVFS